ncbi:hypothetical protein EJ06DRAFT_585465 [Trichodelitschia bisporula]|uniref:Uncharacterized protein n=1 Tax=Trichodelitschia bisporula TaxID=703511 RepID=A0A6G1HJZ9_9PEZI|nr:hypothetical protein EJ06DRAFT_585465 [Trichodelitschia bisporula]
MSQPPTPKRLRRTPPLPPAQTPTRASYLSPTRASLARGHPDIFAAQSPRRISRPTSNLPGMEARPSDAGAYLRDPARKRGRDALEYVMGRAEREGDTVERGRNADEDMEDVPDLEPDDDLPETPEKLRRQMDMQDPPPRGVYYASPSQRQKGKGKAVMRDEPTPEPEDEELPDANAGANDAVAPIQAEKPAEPDPAVKEKEAERDKLRKERAALEAEVAEYEELLSMPDDEVPMWLEDYIKLINADAPPQPTQPPLSTLLTSFLPFSLPAPSPPPTMSDPIPSNSPLSPSLADLRAFTPFTITSTPHPPEGTSQTHTITLISPASLFTTTLTLLITHPTPQTPTLTTLTLPPLPRWVGISPFLSARAKARDINVLVHALGRWWDISLRRAAVWSTITTNHPALVVPPSPPGPESDSNVRVFRDYAARTLAPHLGQQRLVLARGAVQVAISWVLYCDWVGDVRSELDAEARVPPGWHAADSRKGLERLGETFRGLVAEGGVGAAVEAVIGIFFREEG